MTKIYPQDKACEKQEKVDFILAVSPCSARTNGGGKKFCGKKRLSARRARFKFSRFAVERKTAFFLFRNKQSLDKELNFLKEKNIKLENEAILLESAPGKKMKN